MTDLIDYRLNDGIATLMLNNGKVNALSPEVIAAFNQCLDRAEADNAVVLVTGQAGVFSGGYDLKVMSAGMAQATELVASGSALARRLLAFPAPVVMACSGHAIAKGAFLLLCADYRIGIEGPFQIGLNEVMIGMTMHHAGIVLARSRLQAAAFERAVNNAEMFSPQAAVAAGFLDEVVEPARFQDRAEEVALKLSHLNRKAHASTKRKVRKALLEELDRAIALDREQLLTA